MKIKIIIGILCLGIVSCNNSHNSSKTSSEELEIKNVDSLTEQSIAKQIANAAGIENWDSVSEIAYTFNVDRSGNHTERSWIWHPKTDDVQMTTSNDTVIYNRKNMDSISTNADKAFINDKFWMLAQFQPVWDKDVKISYLEKVIAPISKDTLGKMTVVYGDEGGYTPGDAYDFFYDDNFKVKEWNYRKGNDPNPTISTTWEDYKNLNGLQIATNHKDNTGDFRLYFSNISVKTDK